ncbi:hypothetical protein AB0K21_42315 [Streptosporangium sp. NPDC049248]|uniref:hypothetical protein n=1 Tax=Streptosporangium sp. NPDC049248 TaxID=3155651 RepID=UPI00342120E2
MTIRPSRPASALLPFVAALALSVACVPADAACATTTISTTSEVATPPEPITDGSYRDGAAIEEAEQSEAPPEPITDGSYRDGSATEQDEAPPEPVSDGSPADGADEQGC